MKTVRQFAPEQTPEQRKAQAEIWARHDAETRRTCELFQFWQICQEKPCRRAQSCVGDMHACFARHWPLVPEEQKNWFRAFIKAWAGGVSKQQAARIADAEAARIAALLASLESGGGAV